MFFLPRLMSRNVRIATKEVASQQRSKVVDCQAGKAIRQVTPIRRQLIPTASNQEQLAVGYRRGISTSRPGAMASPSNSGMRICAHGFDRAHQAVASPIDSRTSHHGHSAMNSCTDWRSSRKDFIWRFPLILLPRSDDDRTVWTQQGLCRLSAGSRGGQTS